MGIEWDETVETKRRVRMVVSEYGPTFRDATIDDLRRACEAAGLVVETVERATADLEDRTNLREAYQKLADERDACLDALSEHVSPDATADTPRMIRPSSLLAGIRSLQGRLRDARSDLRDHDAALEAAERRRSSEVTGLGQQLAEVVAQRDDLRARLETAERLHSEAEAQVECRNALAGAQCGVRLTGDTWCKGRLTSAEAAIRSLARARATAHAAGYAEAVADVVAWLRSEMPSRSCESVGVFGYFMQALRNGAHVGAAKKGGG